MRADPRTEREILSVFARGLRAYDAGDWDALLDTFARDEDLIVIGTGEDEWAHGWSQFAEVSRRDLRDLASTNVTVESASVRISRSGITAWAALDCTMSGTSYGQYTIGKMRLSGVLERTGAEWRIVLQHVSVPAHPPGTAWPTFDVLMSAVNLERPALPASLTPDGTITIAFTDIENSTAMALRLGDDGWMQTLRFHNAVVRRHVEDCSGVEVKSYGDGFMLAFSSQLDAVHCAMRLEEEFDRYSRRHPDEPIRLRIGLHCGRAVAEDDDLFGQTVIVASRIAAHARPGEILISAELLDSLASDRPACGEPRTIELKGLPGEHTVIPVIWEPRDPEAVLTE